MRTFVLLTLVTSLSACATAPTPRASNDESSERDVLEVWNAQAQSGATRDELHGISVDDPFRALEQDDEATQRWINGQSRRTEWMLSQVELPGVEQRLRALLSIGSLERPVIGGQDVFFLRREGERERSALYRRTPRGDQTLLVAPETYGQRAAIDWFFPSPDGALVAFGISDNGDERSTLRVMRVDDRTLLNETIARTKWSNVAWLNDNSGFYYTRYPAPGEPNYDADEPESYFPRLFFHAIGSDAARDPLVWGSLVKSDFPSISVSDDDRYLLIHNFRGWTASDVRLLDRGEAIATRVYAPDALHPLRDVIVGRDAISNARVHRGAIYLQTDLDAPQGRIVKIGLERADDQSTWQPLYVGGNGTIEDWTLTADTLVVHTIDNVCSRLLLQALSGSGVIDVALPSIGAIESVDGDPRGDRIVFNFSSYFTAPTILQTSSNNRATEPLVSVTSGFDTTQYELSREQVTSKDGATVNVYLMHRRGLIRDGNNPVWLYGYGGFNVSLLPAFSRSALYWLERGGVYAVANIRGGGEHGEAWHRDGMREHKHKVFEDFEAVIAWLSSSKLSRPGRIAISGGSNGGLLMGAMLTRVPEQIAAVIASVGLYDMVRYTKFPPAALWISEYGDPEQPQDLRYLHAYSPYHQVRDGERYPMTLIETADHDTRVHWAHSTKLTARLQSAAQDPTRIYFYMERALGHGRGTSLADQVARQLRVQRFMTRALGM